MERITRTCRFLKRFSLYTGIVGREVAFFTPRRLRYPSGFLIKAARKAASRKDRSAADFLKYALEAFSTP